MTSDSGHSNNKEQGDKHGTWKYLPTLTLSILFIGFGLYLTINNLIIVGTYSRTMQPTAKGGGIYIFVGLIFLVVTYFSISPFSRLRQFIEGKTHIKRDKSKKAQMPRQK
jgi:hypothetical protein